MNKITILPCLMGFLLSVGCAHNIKKSNFSSTTSASEMINTLETKLKEAYNMQADVLAAKDFKKGRDLFLDAREELAETEVEYDEVREDAEFSRAYLERAIKKASSRSNSYNSILNAREAARNAGAPFYENTSEELEDIDKKANSYTSKFTKKMSPKKHTKIQQAYLDLEVVAVQESNLNEIEKMIENAKDNGGDYKATNSYNKALKDFSTAKNLIAKNPRTPREYNTQVDTAFKSTLYLVDVMDVIETREGQVSESIATEIVNKDRKLGRKDARLGQLRAKNNNLDSALGLTTSKLHSANSKVSFQRAMDSVRKQFDNDEAEVYQQGDSLLIRMKKINFAVGKSVIPEKSRDSLKKVNNIIADLNPRKVIVQGHTDSTGKKDYNKKLSTQRAKSVAQYFERSDRINDVAVKGYGESKPLVANNSKSNREINRRVDIVIQAGSNN